ncbi:hypothetical protein E2C01_015976 [Portunus trituberculatus]|uniref:Uncharacterized protein n=1 Tax=Portunus trituberculatus TaxID=210409 RepID=A0A5B7DPC4_PORTR|nr:hypothetical protein [Portunus trituberculatus]
MLDWQRNTLAKRARNHKTHFLHILGNSCKCSFSSNLPLSPVYDWVASAPTRVELAYSDPSECPLMRGPAHATPSSLARTLRTAFFPTLPVMHNVFSP